MISFALRNMASLAAPATISLFDLVTASAVLADRAGTIIQHVKREGKLNIIDKSGVGGRDLDPCTVADVLSQRLITRHLRQLFPGLHVRGEEDEQEEDPQQKAAIEMEPSVLSLYPELSLPVLESPLARALDQSLWFEAKSSCACLSVLDSPDNRIDAVPLRDVIVWVDPLDGTRDFTEDLLDAVTVLIGVSVRGRSCAGVMLQPFSNFNSLLPMPSSSSSSSCAAEDDPLSVYSADYQPIKRNFVGIQGVGTFEVTHNQDAQSPAIRCRKIQLPFASSASSERRVVVTTRSRMGAELSASIESVTPTAVRLFGGCGAKAILLMHDQADAYVYPVKGTKKWDTCAPEALICGAGGAFVDGRGNQLINSLDVDVNNVHGLVAVQDPAKLESFIPSTASIPSAGSKASSL